MDRYQLFRMFLDLVADHYDVTEAQMKNYAEEIEIIGEYKGQTIRVRVGIEGVEKDA